VVLKEYKSIRNFLNEELVAILENVDQDFMVWRYVRVKTHVAGTLFRIETLESSQ